MKNKEIEELLKDIKDKYSYEPYDTSGKVYTTISYDEGQLLLSYIEQLEKKAELGEHYKYLYSQLKKQKDDVVEYIKKHTYNPSRTKNDDRLEVNPKDLLRMLGEIDVED